jgi:hypothetical protein
MEIKQIFYKIVKNRLQKSKKYFVIKNKTVNFVK